jgi:predicted dehydrogenase
MPRGCRAIDPAGRLSMGIRMRVGLIGAGWVTQHHLRAWAAVADRAEVVAVADPSQEAREARMRTFGIPQGFADAEEMLASLDLDAVDIAAPRAHHVALVERAAARGLPILCQKPLAPTLAEAEALVAVIGPDIRLMIHENWRFRACYRTIAAWLRSESIGAPFAARLSLVTSGMLLDANAVRPALVRQPFMGGERRLLVAEVLIHHLDVLRMLFGPLEVAACRLGRICPDLIGEDTAIIQLHGVGGLAVQVFASLSAPGHRAEAVDRLEVLGTRGSIVLDVDTLRRTGAEPCEHSYDLAAAYQGSYDATIAHFVARLADGQPFETAPDDNLKSLALVEACYRLAALEESRR